MTRKKKPSFQDCQPIEKKTRNFIFLKNTKNNISHPSAVYTEALSCFYIHLLFLMVFFVKTSFKNCLFYLENSILTVMGCIQRQLTLFRFGFDSGMLQQFSKKPEQDGGRRQRLMVQPSFGLNKILCRYLWVTNQLFTHCFHIMIFHQKRRCKSMPLPSGRVCEVQVLYS